MITQPVSVYINWAAYDELSDNVELTEELAMQQLDELLRLREAGVRFDYYLMDAFWYARDGAYRTWRKPHWPNGPDRWLERCLANDVKPGLWVATNALSQLDPGDKWRESVDGGSLCFFHGGYLADFLDALSYWYRRGVRMFKFDFTNFGAAPPEMQAVMLPSEIRAANVAALQGGLKAFRKAHPEVVLIAYNGFEELPIQWRTDYPLRKGIDFGWLETFDTLYCGDPRPADVPCMNFWRAKDIFSDHQTRYYEFNGFPLHRIDNAGFMVGTTGTCYNRRTAAWQGMLLLSLARGGWMNTYYGNLDLLDAAKAAWFAKAQGMYLDLQRRARFETFGGLPGNAEPYGFAAYDGADALFAVVNPSQQMAQLALPAQGETRLLFRDAGFVPELSKGSITLGPEQMALVGVGRYADETSDLGVQEDVIIPRSITRLEASFAAAGEKAITAKLLPPATGKLRIILRQTDPSGASHRTSGGSPPAGKLMGQILRIEASQGGQPVPVEIQYDKPIWSGLSWAAGEIACAALSTGAELTIRCSTEETAQVILSGELHQVEY